MSKLKKIVAFVLAIFLVFPVLNASATTKLEIVKKSLQFNSDDDLKGHTEKDLLTKNYDFNRNAKFTSNTKLMYRFTLAYAVRNTASRDKGTLYTNTWFENHYKEILDKAYDGANTTVDFYKNKKGEPCVKIFIKNIYLGYGTRDAIREEVIHDLAECGVVLKESNVKVTSSQKKNSTRINPIPGLSDTLSDLFGAADDIFIDYQFLNIDSKEETNNSSKNFVRIYVNSTFQEAIDAYVVVNNVKDFKAVMRMFNAIEFDNLLNIEVVFKDYTISNTGCHTSEGHIASRYGLHISSHGKDCADTFGYENRVHIWMQYKGGHYDDLSDENCA